MSLYIVHRVLAPAFNLVARSLQRKTPGMTNTLVKRIREFLLLSIGLGILGCSSSSPIVEWREEVKINDGRTIVIEQKEKCDPGYSGKEHELCIARETWVTLNLPEFSPDPIVWHQNLFAIVVNISAGHLYIVGCPPTQRELEAYGNPKPPYLGFTWSSGQWVKIPFGKIPVDIYDTNIFIGNAPGTKYLTLSRKNSSEKGMRGSPTTVQFLKRIDPSL